MTHNQSLKSQVIKVLEELPKTRESDQYLTLIIWQKFCKEYIHYENGKPYIFLEDIMRCPREDNCKRIRAKLNSQGLYLPTSQEVIKARQKGQEKWQRDLGYNYKPNL